MGKTYQDKNSKALIKLLRRINQGADPRLIRKEAHQLLPNISADDLQLAEKDLVKQGYSAQLAEHLSKAFMLMSIIDEKDTEADVRRKVPDNHILSIITAEHQLALCFIADLEQVTEAIQSAQQVTDTCTEFRKLCHIVEHLVAMFEHIEREEYIIFPYLRRHGWNSLCRTVRSDHIYIRVAVNDLIRLIGGFDINKQKEFKSKLASITKYVAPTIREHIFQEDKIIYPIALEIIKDSAVWDRIKALCDEIGYCGVHV